MIVSMSSSSKVMVAVPTRSGRLAVEVAEPADDDAVFGVGFASGDRDAGFEDEPQLEPAAERLAVGPQRRQVQVGLPFDAGDARLFDLERVGELRLGHRPGLAQLREGQLPDGFGVMFGDPFRRARARADLVAELSVVAGHQISPSLLSWSRWVS